MAEARQPVDTEAVRRVLADGSAVDVRPIRPDDKQQLVDGLRRLSPESRYRRFLSPTPDLSARELAYLTEVDHHRHEALVAFDVQDGSGVAVARYVASQERPDEAEMAIAVADDWQRRGVGTLLVDLLADRAREEGIRRFTATVLSANRPMLELLDDLGEPRVLDAEQGTVELVMDLPTRPGAGIRGLLRRVAQRLLEVRPPRPGSRFADESGGYGRGA